MKIVSLKKDATGEVVTGVGSATSADSSCQNATSNFGRLRLLNRCDPQLHFPALCLLSRGSQVRSNQQEEDTGV